MIAPTLVIMSAVYGVIKPLATRDELVVRGQAILRLYNYRGDQELTVYAPIGGRLSIPAPRDPIVKDGDVLAQIAALPGEPGASRTLLQCSRLMDADLLVGQKLQVAVRVGMPIAFGLIVAWTVWGWPGMALALSSSVLVGSVAWLVRTPSRQAERVLSETFALNEFDSLSTWQRDRRRRTKRTSSLDSETPELGSVRFRIDGGLNGWSSLRLSSSFRMARQVMGSENRSTRRRGYSVLALWPELESQIGTRDNHSLSAMLARVTGLSQSAASAAIAAIGLFPLWVLAWVSDPSSQQQSQDLQDASFRLVQERSLGVTTIAVAVVALGSYAFASTVRAQQAALTFIAQKSELVKRYASGTLGAYAPTESEVRADERSDELCKLSAKLLVGSEGVPHYGEDRDVSAQSIERWQGAVKETIDETLSARVRRPVLVNVAGRFGVVLRAEGPTARLSVWIRTGSNLSESTPPDGVSRDFELRGGTEAAVASFEIEVSGTGVRPSEGDYAVELATRGADHTWSTEINGRLAEASSRVQVSLFTSGRYLDAIELDLSRGE